MTTPFSLIPLTQPAQSLGFASVFEDITLSQLNFLKQDGDGRLVIEVSGADPIKVPTALIVFGRFGGEKFGSTRRQFYAKDWAPGQENTAPDCTSQNGDVPDVSSPAPQSVTCKGCPHTTSGKCGYRKDFIVYRVQADATGQAMVDTDTPLVWQASSKSLFPEFDKNTNAGGVLKLLPLLVRKFGETVESLVFELGFFNGTKAPVIKVVGRLPAEVAREVNAAANSDDVNMLLTNQVDRAKTPNAAALPAPKAAAPLAQLPRSAPVAALPVAPAPVVAAPAPAPVVAAPAPAPAPAPVVAAPAPVVAAPAPVVAAPAPVVAAPAADGSTGVLVDTPFGKMTQHMFNTMMTMAQQQQMAAQPGAAVPVAAPVAAPAPAAGRTSRSAALAAFKA